MKSVTFLLYWVVVQNFFFFVTKWCKPTAVSSLKGAMVALFYHFFLIPNMSCPQTNSKNNGQGLLFKTILWRTFCYLAFVATDVKDGNRSKLEKVWPTSHVLMLSQQKIPKKYIMGRTIFKHFIRYSPHSLSGTFCA